MIDISRLALFVNTVPGSFPLLLQIYFSGLLLNYIPFFLTGSDSLNRLLKFSAVFI